MSSSSESEGGDVSMDLDGKAETFSSFQPFTKAERIQQLNDIDKSITQLLRSAGLAVKTLTTLQRSSGKSTEEDSQDFSAATDTYLNALHSVDIRLKRQIHGLVEASIIAKESQGVLGKPEGQSQDSTRNATDRGWDVGWLNTRSGKVGRDMEAELWANAREFLEGLEVERNNGVAPAKANGDAGDTEMED